LPSRLGGCTTVLCPQPDRIIKKYMLVETAELIWVNVSARRTQLPDVRDWGACSFARRCKQPKRRWSPGLFSTEMGHPRHVRFRPVSDRTADIAGGPFRANRRHERGRQLRRPTGDKMTDVPFKVGDRVKKRSGYEYPGFIVSVFTNRAGAVRYVVEADHPAFSGMLHIFNGDQLEHR
jgi:hypothetical protein